MEILDRRDCMIKLLSSAAVLATGTAALAEETEKKQGMSRANSGDFWKRVDSLKARDLVNSALKAAHAEIESQRATNSAIRASILLGSGAEFEKQAEMHYQTRTAELQKAQQALARYVKNVGASGNERFTSFVERGDLKALADHARQTTLQTLVKSDITPDEARSAVKVLKERLEKIQSLKSFDEASSYLDKHLSELIERKMVKEDPNGLCIFILLISSLYAMLVIIAILICIFGCSVQQTLNRLLAQLCGD